MNMKYLIFPYFYLITFYFFIVIWKNIFNNFSYFIEKSSIKMTYNYINIRNIFYENKYIVIKNFEKVLKGKDLEISV